MDLFVREATLNDAKKIADLSCQLDHEMTEAEAAERLPIILADKYQKLFVAEKDNEILGYASVYANYELLSGIQARIGGVVVDSNARGLGVGKYLMQATEKWAKEMGSKSMKLASNVKRVEAHKFYEKIGYTRTKDQAQFKRIL